MTKRKIMGKAAGRRTRSSIVSALVLFLCCGVGLARGEAQKEEVFSAFELPVPKEEGANRYLGVAGKGNFSIADVKAEALIVEVFSMYCPHCQREAPRVNELYRKIEDSPALKGKVKVIGIGAGNSPFEVNLFRETYKIPFPLFSDEDLSIARRLKVTGTPTFICFKIDGPGKTRSFYTHVGPMEETSSFLKKVATLAGLPEGN